MLPFKVFRATPFAVRDKHAHRYDEIGYDYLNEVSERKKRAHGVPFFYA